MSSRRNTRAPLPPQWLEAEIRDYIGTAADAPASSFRAALDAWRNRLLQHTLQSARENSLFYRKHWQHTDVLPVVRKQGNEQSQRQCAPHNLHLNTAQGVPEHSIACLQQLPFTLPEHIAENAEQFLAVSHNDVAGLTTVPTSGTSGQSKRIFCTAADLQRTVRFFQFGMRPMLDPSHKETVALLMSGQREGSVGHLLKTALQEWGVSCHVLGVPHNMDDTAHELALLQPSCIVGMPVHLQGLAHYTGSPRIATRLHTVLLSGDSASQTVRQKVAEAFHCRVFNHYGLTESGFGGAVECHEHHGCHVREADLFFEIVDDTGAPVPAGIWGEVVMTTLSREAMPLIRYKTGDFGRLLEGECPCGSVLQRLEVQGRMQARITLPQGNVLHTEMMDALCYAVQGIYSYSLVLHTMPPCHNAKETHGRQCLAITLQLAPQHAKEAVGQLEQRLARVPGLVPVRNEEELHNAPESLLPVAVVCRENTAHAGSPVCSPATKQYLHTSEHPFFFTASRAFSH